jgi:uncharacterized protein
MTQESYLYVGSVMHRRFRPRPHHFRYRVFWMLLDLNELPRLSEQLKLFSYDDFNLFEFRDSDHGDGTSTPLRTQVHGWLADAGCSVGDGPIRLLCMPRTLGFCFNPLSVYFCYGADGTLAALVYQVHNTFGGRHRYVFPVGRENSAARQQCAKDFFVSPFLDMDLRYRFRLSGPGDRIALAIRARSALGPMMDAVMSGARRDLTDRELARLALAIPVVTVKVVSAIHWEALRLWFKGLRFRPERRAHPVATSSVGVARADVSE